MKPFERDQPEFDWPNESMIDIAVKYQRAYFKCDLKLIDEYYRAEKWKLFTFIALVVCNLFAWA